MLGLQIDVESDLSLVPRISKNETYVLKDGNDFRCTRCQNECQKELLTCAFCDLKVHYKCYDSQSTTKAGETKRRPMAESTYKVVSKLENVAWLCNSCESPCLFNHILDVASEKVKAKVAACTTQENDSSRNTTISRNDAGTQTEQANINHPCIYKNEGPQDGSIPRDQISDISTPEDQVSLICSDTCSFSNNSLTSLSLQPIVSTPSYEDPTVEKTPKIKDSKSNKCGTYDQVKDSLEVEPLSASTPERRWEETRNQTAIKFNSLNVEKRHSEDHDMNKEAQFSPISQTSNKVFDLNSTLSDQVDVLASQHSTISSLERAISKISSEIKEFRVDEKKHFNTLKKELTDKFTEHLRKKDPPVEEPNHFITVGKGLNETLTTLQNITEENNNILKEMEGVQFKRTLNNRQASRPVNHLETFRDVAKEDNYEGKQVHRHQPIESTVDKTKTVLVTRGIARKYLKNSGTIKSTFNRYFTEMPIQSTFLTKGGSLMIELTSKEDAQRVEESWQASYFAEGDIQTECKILEKLTWAVIIKDVPTGISDSNIAISLRRHYPGATANRFVTRNKTPLRTIKVNFQSEEDWANCVSQGVKIEQQIYSAEEYKPRRRVIQCFNCYRFGHVAKLCHQNHATCSTCGYDHHSSKCTSSKRDYCVNCDVFGHDATAKECPVYLDILKKLNLQPRNVNNMNRLSTNPTYQSHINL